VGKHHIERDKRDVYCDKQVEEVVLSQSLDNLGTTQGECLERTWWSSPLDLTTYLYYFTSGCVPIIIWSHVLPEHSMITWPCHMIWLPNFPCYLYLDPVIRLDVRDQMFECVGNSFLSRALITGNDSSQLRWWGSKGIDHRTKVITNGNVKDPLDILQLCTNK